MKIQIYQLSGPIDINGKLETQRIEKLEDLPEQIQLLFKTTSQLTMIALQINTPNGTVSAVYKKVNE